MRGHGPALPVPCAVHVFIMPRYEVVVDTGTLTSPGHELSVSGPEGRHLSRVRRIRPGAHARIKDGLGLAFTARVLSVSGDTVRFELMEQVPSGDDTLPLILAPAVIKGKRMDWLIQKACELGVREIQPVITRRTVVRPDDGVGRQRRWHSIAVQALKQCSGNRLTLIHSPLFLGQLLDISGGLFKIMLCEVFGKRTLMSTLFSEPQTETACMLLGPEGGFAPDEISRCAEAGFIQVTLGSRILRTETAAVAAVAQFAAVVQGRVMPAGLSTTGGVIVRPE